MNMNAYAVQKEKVEETKKKATEAMCAKLGTHWKASKAEFTFDNGSTATVERKYAGAQEYRYTLTFEGDVLCETTNPFTCGWALYVLGCDNK